MITESRTAKGIAMNTALEALIEKARAVKMTEAQLREQRISFVYGNTHIENERITREMVVQADARVSQETEAHERLGQGSEE